MRWVHAALGSRLNSTSVVSSLLTSCYNAPPLSIPTQRPRMCRGHAAGALRGREHALHRHWPRQQGHQHALLLLRGPHGAGVQETPAAAAR